MWIIQHIGFNHLQVIVSKGQIECFYQFILPFPPSIHTGLDLVGRNEQLASSKPLNLFIIMKKISYSASLDPRIIISRKILESARRTRTSVMSEKANYPVPTIQEHFNASQASFVCAGCMNKTACNQKNN
jgi:hypothetical protein